MKIHSREYSQLVRFARTKDENCGWTLATSLGQHKRRFQVAQGAHRRTARSIPTRCKFASPVRTLAAALNRHTNPALVNRTDGVLRFYRRAPFRCTQQYVHAAAHAAVAETYFRNNARAICP